MLKLLMFIHLITPIFQHTNPIMLRINLATDKLKNHIPSKKKFSTKKPTKQIVFSQLPIGLRNKILLKMTIYYNINRLCMHFYI